MTGAWALALGLELLVLTATPLLLLAGARAVGRWSARRELRALAALDALATEHRRGTR